MGSLYKLITKTNLKSPTLAFPLAMPLIFILLYSVGIGADLDQAGVDAAIAGFLATLLSLLTMQSGLMGFGINFMSIKKSVLLRRIGATKLKKSEVVGAVLLFGLTLWAITIVWIFAMVIFLNWAGLFYSIQVKSGLGNVMPTSPVAFLALINWPKILAALIVMLLVSYAIGLFFTTIARDVSAFQGMAMLYFFSTSFLGGMMFPGATPEWMHIFGYIIPNAYAGELFQWAADWPGVGVVAVPDYKLALDFIVPLVFAVIFFGASVKLLKFD